MDLLLFLCFPFEPKLLISQGVERAFTSFIKLYQWGMHMAFFVSHC